MLDNENGDGKYVLGSNDMEVTDCYFARCESGKGGALYFQDDTKEGDEETFIVDCIFTDCYVSGEKYEGYSIHCISY